MAREPQRELGVTEEQCIALLTAWARHATGEQRVRVVQFTGAVSSEPESSDCASADYEQGKLERLFEESQLCGAELERRRRAAHAPTLLMRGDSPQIQNIVSRERERDPDNALREFDAQFIGGGAHAFFDPRKIGESTDANLRLPVAHDKAARVFVGCDWGFVADSTAAVVVQAIGKMLFVSDILELRPGKGAPLVPSEAAVSVSAFGLRYKADAITADWHYGEAMSEHTNREGVRIQRAPEGQNGKALVYTVARSLLHEGRVRLPNHGRLIAQLRQVIGKAMSGGAIQISSPRWRQGGHGDLCSALVLALWQANEATNLWTHVPLVQADPDRHLRHPVLDGAAAAQIHISSDGRARLLPASQSGGIFSGGGGGFGGF